VPVTHLCKLYSVRRSSYYLWRDRPVSARGVSNRRLLDRVLVLADKFHHIYGYRKLLIELHKEGYRCSKNRLWRLLKQAGYKARLAVRRRVYGASQGLSAQPNLLQREFNPASSNQVWVSDITQLACREGWLYLSVVMDLHSRKIVGYQCSNNVTSAIVLESIKKGWKASNPPSKHRLLFHSDQGSQYRSEQVMSWLTEKGVTISMSRKGNCWDNACAESFFSVLKKEWTGRLGLISRTEMAQEIKYYISCFYNTIRSHSAIGYRSPVEIRS
jgi:putative transposase